MKTYKETATPGHSLFSLDTTTHKVRFELKSNYTLDDLEKGIRHNYEYKTDGSYIYTQAENLRQARRKFNQFIKNANEKAKSNKVLQGAQGVR